MILEFRTYTMKPGTRDRFLKFFAEEAAPRMREIGMTVLGPFASMVDENELAYGRTFESVEERERLYPLYYESQDWLGWMIDTAMGDEESFTTFFGGTDVDGVPDGAVHSGIHTTRFVLASATGPITALTSGTVTVQDGDGGSKTFTMADTTRVFDVVETGMTPATPLVVADLRVGDTVLVLGSDHGETLAGRQIVRRPADLVAPSRG